jgi:hypothetical protein
MREKILAMEAGRELDALVCEHVLDMEVSRNIHTNLPTWSNMPNYSTDISAAWEVVEKMDSKGFDVMILVRGGKHRVEFGIIADVERNTTPHAICIAALLAVIEP